MQEPKPGHTRPSRVTQPHIKSQFAEKRWITSDAAEKDENGRYKDPAAGVAILLSKRMADKVMSWGNVGARIVWVRLAGPICNLFVVVTYIPHKGRVSPSADDTIGELHTLLKSVAKSDCIVLLGDFNCQLPRNVEGCTGKWSMTTRSDNAHGNKILDLMRAYDLFATDTLFKPVKKKGGETAKGKEDYATQHICQKTRVDGQGNLIICVCRTGGRAW